MNTKVICSHGFEKCCCKHTPGGNIAISLSLGQSMKRCSWQFSVWEMLNLSPLPLPRPEGVLSIELTKTRHGLHTASAPGTLVAQGRLHRSMWPADANRSYKICKACEVQRSFRICPSTLLILLIYQDRLNVITRYFYSKSMINSKNTAK